MSSANGLDEDEEALRERARGIREHERMLKSKEAEFMAIKERAEKAEVKARDTWLRAQVPPGVTRGGLG